MGPTCDYCRGKNEAGVTNCKNCGAPLPGGAVTAAALTHVHECPNCGRKLLTLASPACNYCGMRLPEDYITAREADLKRINALNIHPDNASAGLEDIASHGDGSNLGRLLSDITKMFS